LNERDDGPPKYRDVLTDERLGLMSRWESDGAVHLAVERTIAAHAGKGERHGHGYDFSPEAIAAYCEILAAREALLDEDQWLANETNVFQESSAWGLHAQSVVALARAVRIAVRPLSTFGPKPALRRMSVRETREAWDALKAPLLNAINDLRAYAKPNQAAESLATAAVPTSAPVESPPEGVALPSPPYDTQGFKAASKTKHSRRRTPRGGARPLIFAQLNAHHRYNHAQGLNFEPIGNNKLAELIGVNQSTTSDFFKAEFGDYESYCRTCADPEALAVALRLLNGEVKPRNVFGRASPGEGGRPEDA
jgi:hypothetical protein